MNIVFFTDCVNHHQIFVADELYKMTFGNYRYVTTVPFPEYLAKKGYPNYSNRQYILPAWENEGKKNEAKELALSADVAIFMGNQMEEYEIPRLKAKRLTLEYSERRLKKGIVNLLSPNLIRHQLMYYRYGKRAPLYMLCSSGYAANDFYFMHSFKERCYKWGYFPKVDEIDIEVCISKRDNNVARLMWCSRFIDWKHPELPIYLAQRLKRKNINFIIDMYGAGGMQDEIQGLAKALEVEDYVVFHGNISNDQIVKEMQKHHIFLFTSDKGEGWGAVANEAMGGGCCLIASNEIGSVPFLVKDKKNGLIFKSKDIDSLSAVVESVICNRDVLDNLGRNAYKTIEEFWSPIVAARNLYRLVGNLIKGQDTPILIGPCSKAVPYHYEK